MMHGGTTEWILGSTMFFSIKKTNLGSVNHKSLAQFEPSTIEVQ